MQNEILEFAQEMYKVMNKHQKRKGNSWKTCSISYLERKLQEEFTECVLEKNSKECIDLANICMMLFYRYGKLK